MKQTLKNLIKSSLKGLNIGKKKRARRRQKIRENKAANHDIQLLLTLPNEHASQLLKLLRKSKSQHRQDLFVLSQLDFKRDGYFVEIGAADGFNLSNTYLLEKEFGWAGVLVEPALCWHKELINNRNAHIETRCAWSESNKVLKFNEVDRSLLSTISSYSNTDSHRNQRKSGKYYDVKTVSLNDLLIKFDAPKEIDYLSIDTEGSEYEILNNFDFSKHHFRIITCEHNFTEMREKIFQLLSRKGYIRKFEELSRCDDWYSSCLD